MGRSHTTCHVRRAAMTALPGRTAARQTLPTAIPLRRPTTISGTARTTRRRRRHRSPTRLTIRAAECRSHRRRRAAIRRQGMAQRPRCRVRQPDIPTMRRRRTRLLPAMEVVMDRLHPPRRGAMDQVGHLAAGARDRTPHRTLQQKRTGKTKSSRFEVSWVIQSSGVTRRTAGPEKTDGVAR